MATVQTTVETYKALGILKDCKALSVIWNRDNQIWDVVGHFQNENGRRNGKVASFEQVADAVEFERTAR